MIVVASLDDPRIASYRDVANPAAIAHAGLFVAEGRFVVQRLLTNRRYRTCSLLLTASAFDALEPDIPPDVACYVVAQPVMNEIVGLEIHRGCLALAERPASATLTSLPLASYRRVVVLEGVNNPDNIGGIFRSAAAFGVDAVVLGPACGDPLYRKAVRTSMAATLQVPYAIADEWPGSLQLLRANGVRVVALTPGPDARPLHEVPRDLARVALLLGTEGSGLSRAALAAADERVTIPMRGEVDSLNVTVAASLALYHFA